MGTNSTHFLGLGCDILFRKRYRKIHHKSFLLHVNKVILEISKCLTGIFQSNWKAYMGILLGLTGGKKNPKTCKRKYSVKLYKKCCFPWQHLPSKTIEKN